MTYGGARQLRDGAIRLFCFRRLSRDVVPNLWATPGPQGREEWRCTRLLPYKRLAITAHCDRGVASAWSANPSQGLAKARCQWLEGVRLEAPGEPLIRWDGNDLAIVSKGLPLPGPSPPTGSTAGLSRGDFVYFKTWSTVMLAGEAKLDKRLASRGPVRRGYCGTVCQCIDDTGEIANQKTRTRGSKAQP